MSQSQQLAAIMFTDIVGYTKLMGSDEEYALNLLRKSREIQQKQIERHHGHLVKEMGDGMLAKFSSATEATHCAIEIQKQAQPTDLNERIRIGIHLGEITEENNDTFGDGVNIASRLQTIADPGGIYISESLQKSIRANADIHTRFLGEFELKNVNFKLKTYAVLGYNFPTTPPSKIKELKGKNWQERVLGSPILYMAILTLALAGWWANTELFDQEPTISSLVFLPFDDYTGSDTLDYIMAGMHDALIGEAGKIGALRVPGTKTATAYRDATKSTSEIASELNVDAIVETSVSCIEDDICFQVKLITSFPEEKQIWVKDFKVEKEQIINWYRGLAKEISNQIKISLTPDEEVLLASTDAIDPRAYELYLKGKFYLNNDPSPANISTALSYFESSIALDSTFAPAYAGISTVWIFRWQLRMSPVAEAVPKIYSYNQKALELDENYPESHYLKALMSAQSDWDWTKSEAAFQSAIKANPNHALAHAHYGHLLMFLQRFDEAQFQMEEALRIEPLSPFILGLYGVVLGALGEVDKASELINRDSSAWAKRGLMERIAYLKGDYKESIDLLEARFGDDSVMFKKVRDQFINNGYPAAMGVLARHMDKDTLLSAVGKAVFYNRAGLTDDVIRLLEEGYKNHDTDMPYAFSPMEFKNLESDPRYREIAQKMNLPI